MPKLPQSLFDLLIPTQDAEGLPTIRAYDRYTREPIAPVQDTPWGQVHGPWGVDPITESQVYTRDYYPEIDGGIQMGQYAPSKDWMIFNRPKYLSNIFPNTLAHERLHSVVQPSKQPGQTLTHHINELLSKGHRDVTVHQQPVTQRFPADVSVTGQHQLIDMLLDPSPEAPTQTQDLLRELATPNPASQRMMQQIDELMGPYRVYKEEHDAEMKRRNESAMKRLGLRE